MMFKIAQVVTKMLILAAVDESSKESVMYLSSWLTSPPCYFPLYCKIVACGVDLWYDAQYAHSDHTHCKRDLNVWCTD